MAKPLDDESKESLVGRAVYVPFEPKNPGIVIGDNRKTGSHRIVNVWWLSGKESADHVLSLNDFQSLVEETERKAKAHRDRFEQLKARGTGKD